ncbi:unnamed protein product [Linum tenue]|uniref:Uncharacterized protein n=1 Tax=Linum tenue TaxID=586396 RepID=A0AAV0P3P8_9ROSI|nr:unnamed protein product [Linum tenue]
MQNDKDCRMMTKRKTRSSSKLMDESRGKKGRTEDGVIQIDGDLQADWNDLVRKGRTRFSYLQFAKKGETKFTLPKVLKYTREEVNLAHYIFAKDLPEKEVLVETMMQSYTRQVLWSLCPKSNVADDVITTMACQLSLEEVWRVLEMEE